MLEEELRELLSDCGFGSTDSFEDLLNKAKTFDVLSKYKEYILTLVEELADEYEDIKLIEENL